MIGMSIQELQSYLLFTYLFILPFMVPISVYVMNIINNTAPISEHDKYIDKKLEESTEYIKDKNPLIFRLFMVILNSIMVIFLTIIYPLTFVILLRILFKK